MAKIVKLCACGCGKAVRRPYENRYASQACVPLSVRLEGIQKGRQGYIYRQRALLLRALIQPLMGKRFTHEDLLAVGMAIYRKGYQRGHKAARAYHTFRARRKESTAA